MYSQMNTLTRIVIFALLLVMIALLRFALPGGIKTTKAHLLQGKIITPTMAFKIPGTMPTSTPFVFRHCLSLPPMSLIKSPMHPNRHILPDAPQNQIQLLQNTGFDSGQWSPWQIGGASELSSDVYRSAPYAAWLGGYDNAQDIVFQAVTVPAKATELVLSFWLTIESEENQSQADFTCADIVDGNGNSQISGPYCADFSHLSQNQWLNEQLVISEGDLAQLLGQTVFVVFWAVTNSDATSSIWLDDVTLDVTDNEPLPSSSRSYLPVVSCSTNVTPMPTSTPEHSIGVYGQVYMNGTGDSNIQLILRHCTATVCSDLLTTTTDSSGNYRFSGVPPLLVGETYHVLFLNNSTVFDGRLKWWRSFDIASYDAQSDVHGGSFDIVNVELWQPNDNSRLPLPIRFTWIGGGGSYEYWWELRDPFLPSFTCSSDKILSTREFVLTESMSYACGLHPGRGYLWHVYVIDGDWSNGYGASFFNWHVQFTR